MKVLWITNIVLPEAMQLLKGHGELKATGGWMVGAANALTDREDVVLAVAAPSKSVTRLERLNGAKTLYYLFPYGKGNVEYNIEYESYWKEIEKDFCPDVVHIHGTESSHGLAYVNACGTKKTVVSIQGLVSVYERYYNDGLSTIDILRNITIRDIIKGTTLLQGRKKFQKKGKAEVDLLKKVHHVIGRTSWDRAHVWSINSHAKYHFCNETLRPEFYEGKWNYKLCTPFTIFLSSSAYPIKGFHQLLKSMPLVLREYPQTQIRVAGSFYKTDSFLQRMRINGYTNYFARLIKKFDLTNHITFLGSLNATQMKDEFLRSNLYLCPSSIENSPNSLGEAQILGVPVLASYVGGIPDMMQGDEKHLYRFEEVEMLASKICKIFEEKDTINTEIMRQKAQFRHDAINNANQLLEIYQSVIGNGEKE